MHWDYHSLGLTRIHFHPMKVTPPTNPAKVTEHGLCYCNSDAWGWHNSHQSGVIRITDQSIFQNGKKLRSVQEALMGNNNGPKTLPCGTPDASLRGLFCYKLADFCIINSYWFWYRTLLGAFKKKRNLRWKLNAWHLFERLCFTINL